MVETLVLMLLISVIILVLARKPKTVPRRGGYIKLRLPYNSGNNHHRRKYN